MGILETFRKPFRMAGDAYNKLPQPVRTVIGVGKKVGRFGLPALDAIDVITAEDKVKAAKDLGITSAIFSGNPYLTIGGAIASDITDRGVAKGQLTDVLSEEELKLMKEQNKEKNAPWLKKYKEKQREEVNKAIRMAKETLIPLHQKRSKTTLTEDERPSEESRSTPTEDVQPLENTLEEIPVQQQPPGESQADKAMDIAKNELALKYQREKELGMKNIDEIKTALGYEEGSNLAQWADANPALAQRLYAKSR